MPALRKGRKAGRMPALRKREAGGTPALLTDALICFSARRRLWVNPCGLRDCTDAAVLRDFLLERFEVTARERYGTELTLPLVVQLESARQRLRAAAFVEAEERVAGWRTEHVEWKFSFPLAGLTISGKID